jgi:hypothetical protein
LLPSDVFSCIVSPVKIPDLPDTISQQSAISAVFSEGRETDGFILSIIKLE